jgi:hypothetical protein
MRLNLFAIDSGSLCKRLGAVPPYYWTTAPVLKFEGKGLAHTCSTRVTGYPRFGLVIRTTARAWTLACLPSSVGQSNDLQTLTISGG